jgi:hypothetical protein
MKTLGEISRLEFFQYELKLNKALLNFDLTFVMELGEISRLIIHRDKDYNVKVVFVSENFDLYKANSVSELFSLWNKIGFANQYKPDREQSEVNDSIEMFINKLDSKDYTWSIPDDEYDGY